jgi:diketogulonate reductase-like aldo/keto reductase
MTSSTPSAIAHSGLIAAKSEPVFIYDTGGKREETKDLVEEALKVGFRHFDTAALPKRYQERLVGEAIRAWLKAGGSRKDIYVWS